MINKVKLLLILLFLLIITIPVSFSSENTTGHDIDNITLFESNITLSSNDNEIIETSEVYFDVNAPSSGDGSKAKPYNTVTSSYLGTINYFAPGTYKISSALSLFSNEGVAFIGNNHEDTILQYTGSDTFLTSSYDIKFLNITLKGCNIVSKGGSLTALNTVFDSGIAKEETESDNYKYGNSYGGAIKISSSSYSFDWSDIFGGGSSKSINFDNCIFKNNFASYGGAIYADKGTITITNSRFENNHADNGGGSIATLNDVNLTVKNCEFIDDRSVYDAGGAIYLFNTTKASVENTLFNNCSASIGGSISSLISTLTIKNSNFTENKALWTGGAVFSMYGILEINSSKFLNNTAYNGGAIYGDNLTKLQLNSDIFENNHANYNSSAIFVSFSLL